MTEQIVIDGNDNIVQRSRAKRSMERLMFFLDTAIIHDGYFVWSKEEGYSE
jgi:hypothetical protein